MQSLQSTIKCNKTRSACIENVDYPHKVVQESLVMNELEEKKKRLRKRKCPLASMHIWDVSTLTHNHWSIRQASLGNKSGAGSEGNRVSHLVIQLIFMECPQRPGDYSRHLRCKDKQVTFIIWWSEPKPKQLSRGLVMCLAYSFPGLVPWNTLTFLTLSASMSNLSPGWPNMNKHRRATARKLMEAPSAWIEMSWTSSLCLVSLQLGGWFQISGPCLSGNHDRPHPGSVVRQGRGPEHVASSAVKWAGSFTGPASSQREQGTWEPSPDVPLPSGSITVLKGWCFLFRPHVIVTLSDPSKSIVPRHVSPTLPVTHPCFCFLTLITSLAVPSFLVCEDSLRSLALSRKY